MRGNRCIIHYIKNGWSVVYKSVRNEDGSLLFPEKLTEQFLDTARRVMGSYIYANQYLNQIIPNEARVFKKEWFKYWPALPEKKYTFCFIDPAISQQAEADYTGIVIVDTDVERNWYIRVAERRKLTPTQLVNLCFEIDSKYKPMRIGIETVAFQEALIYMLDEEMRRRNIVIPVTGIKHGAEKTKEMRISGLVPRFEFGYVYLAQGLVELESEILSFPRAKHDDIIDALASIDELCFYPTKEIRNVVPLPHQTSEYESHYIQQLYKGNRNAASGGGDEY